MERIIKFRGKRTETNEWVYGLLYVLKGDADLRQNTYTGFEIKRVSIDRVYIVGATLPDTVGWDLRSTMFFYEVHKESVGQFTGLQDKNGKDIYKGDLVRQGGTLYEIRDCIGGFECQIWKEFKHGGAEEGSCYMFSCLSEKYCEVIGNIYETPNLLK